MTYYDLDDDECGTGVHFDWVDATSGQRHDIGGSGEPVYFSTTLPLPFTFYNETYDHVYVNECGSLLFGDDNIYDDCYPSIDPPIPNPTMTDPNNAIHATWGTLYWNPHYDPDQAVYTRHVTDGGRNWFVVEWHHWDDLLGGPDTFELILDLDSSEIYAQYLTVTHPSYAVAGIENAFGTEGVLYVADEVPVENQLHNQLAVKYGVGQTARGQRGLCPALVGRARRRAGHRRHLPADHQQHQQRQRHLYPGNRRRRLADQLLGPDLHHAPVRHGLDGLVHHLGRGRPRRGRRPTPGPTTATGSRWAPARSATRWCSARRR